MGISGKSQPVAISQMEHDLGHAAMKLCQKEGGGVAKSAEKGEVRFPKSRAKP